MIACPKSPKPAPRTNKQAINFDLNPPKYVHTSQKIDVRFRLKNDWNYYYHQLERMKKEQTARLLDAFQKMLEEHVQLVYILGVI
jgi:hypothetical protein